MRRVADTWSIALGRIPAFRGKTHIVNALARIIGMGSTGWGTCSLGNGASIRVDLKDRIERQMWGGCYEPHVQRALRAILAGGDVFVDIGAHVGYHAALAASLVGPGGRVFAFEADPENFSRLRENLAVFSWATALNQAVWSSSGTVGFERSSQPSESGWGTLTSVRDLRTGDHLTMTAISLDDWIRANDVHVSAVKVDAEGSEVGILRGGREFLRRTRPVLIVEANDILLRQAQASTVELTDILRSGGFEIFTLSDESLRPFDARSSSQFGELLAIPEEQAQNNLKRLGQLGFCLHS